MVGVGWGGTVLRLHSLIIDVAGGEGGRLEQGGGGGTE